MKYRDEMHLPTIGKIPFPVSYLVPKRAAKT